MPACPWGPRDRGRSGVPSCSSGPQRRDPYLRTLPRRAGYCRVAGTFGGGTLGGRKHVAARAGRFLGNDALGDDARRYPVYTRRVRTERPPGRPALGFGGCETPLREYRQPFVGNTFPVALSNGATTGSGRPCPLWSRHMLRTLCVLLSPRRWSSRPQPGRQGPEGMVRAGGRWSSDRETPRLPFRERPARDGVNTSVTWIPSRRTGCRTGRGRSRRGSVCFWRAAFPSHFKP